MADPIYIREEFRNKVRVDEALLQAWEAAKLITPVGFTEEKVPFYSEAAIQQVVQIKKLSELGYGLEEIRKIIKQVGLPHAHEPDSRKDGKENYLTVGGLAEKVGVSPRTLKHWETIGIIEPEMRSEGGFRLYSSYHVFFCQLVQDLQRFGYSLEEIKMVSGYFREFLQIQSSPESYSREDTEQKLLEMTAAIETLFGQMNLLKEGIQRWEDLLKKKKKEITGLINRNRKRE